MEDRLRKMLYMAVGLASTSQKIKYLFEKADIEGKLTEEEGKRLLDELWSKGKLEADLLTKEFKDKVAEILFELKTPSQKEFDDLKLRVEKLEAIIKAQNIDA